MHPLPVHPYHMYSCLVVLSCGTHCVLCLRGEDSMNLIAIVSHLPPKRYSTAHLHLEESLSWASALLPVVNVVCLCSLVIVRLAVGSTRPYHSFNSSTVLL